MTRVIISLMEINVLIEEESGGCLEADWIQNIAGQVLIAQGVSPEAELGLVITGQEKVQQLNKNYLGRDNPTDVLAFSLLPEQPVQDSPSFVQPPDGVLHLGEVIISYPQAVVQAEERGHSVKREVAILVIHGILHLLGFEDEKPELKRVMSTREEEILSHIGGGLD